MKCWSFAYPITKSAAYAPIAYLRLMVALDLKIAHELLERRKATGSIN